MTDILNYNFYDDFFCFNFNLNRLIISGFIPILRSILLNPIKPNILYYNLKIDFIKKYAMLKKKFKVEKCC
jgi:hypothetical protein